MRTLSILLLLVGTLIPAASPATAADGTTPIWQPTTITQPGSYVLTRDVSGNVFGGGDSAVILIQASDVTLDLNGFRLSALGNGCDSSACAAIRAQGVDGITVRNGSISTTDGAVGVDLNDVERFLVSDLSIVMAGGIFEAAVRVSGGLSNGRISDNRIGRTRTGVTVLDGSALIINNTFSEHSYTGVNMTGGESQVHENQFFRSGSGILITSSNQKIIGNVFSRCSESIQLSPSSSNNFLSKNIATDSSVPFIDRGSNNILAGDNFLPAQQ